MSMSRIPNFGLAVASVALWLAVTATDAFAQSFFATLVTDPVVGADRGSASQIRKLDERTGFLTFSNTGSDDAGRGVLSLGYAFPDTVRSGDQLDLAGVWAGPSEDGWRELLAGGVAYRFPLGSGALTGFVNMDYGDVILGTEKALSLGVRGDRVQIAAGFVAERDLGQTAKLKFATEIIARRTRSEFLGNPAIDEDLRMLRTSVLYTNGIPLGLQQRLAISFAKGFDALGASVPGNPLGSTPGGLTDFLRVSFAAETSIPLSSLFVLNAGLIGQWTEESLPASQRCGFETNAYARAFDYALVVGDRCLGSRVEMAYNFELPDPRSDRLVYTQGFLGVDGGRINNRGNSLSAGDSDSWASLSVGVRGLRGNFLGEIAATRILEAPDVAAAQDRNRLWIRAAVQF
ncbi:MAG: hypothetical protein CVT84_02545 [Alphaproteobacteria bacterium HGW-Alphaproteobacteria-6]|nr:MAG: hypothetical protein CVT84_02545 [Alphaproteobacteria bacterium HGW-Alphaproteobacteria-6]